MVLYWMLSALQMPLVACSSAMCLEHFWPYGWADSHYLSRSFCLSPLPSLSPPLTQYDRCLEDWVGAHGWIVGIASHRRVILSRRPLVTVEVPGYPRHPFSIQHDEEVNNDLRQNTLFTARVISSWFFHTTLYAAVVDQNNDTLTRG